MLEIEKGVPIPETLPRPGKPGKYPFRSMEVGDSFVAPIEKKNSIYSSMSRIGKNLGRKYSSERNEYTIRVWRVA